ncbi:uncharacterized protein LOC126747093 isoform X2 [Anthonomus grandis grandis]|uniref:uncharacterized protein LOC126747093 isoform X2 n=1 Tax=Anthonomus grandis grandis TaxID=2921223 RepID=UPI0021666377|nr:uncharacterized protein LOC126747093 isoform X2 [Anthonomus grandis grandis]
MLKSLFPWKHNKTKQAMAAHSPMDDHELIIQEHSLLPCHVCGRTFLPNPLKKHEKVCEKNATKKRKPFDSLKQRVAGTDLADFHQPTYLKKKEEPVPEVKPRQSKWKEKHLELVTAIRAAKGVPPCKMPTSPTPKPRSTTSLTVSSSQNERCPSCERHFGPKAFDRHVEWCKERKSRIHRSPASVQQAKERLEARTKYRAPLNKTKRTLVREKYSSSGPQSPEPVARNASSTVNLTSSLSRGPSIRKPKSLVNVEKTPETKAKKPQRGAGEKCDGDRKRCAPEYERASMTLNFDASPVIGSPSPKAESVRSFQTKRAPLPQNKLNSIDINAAIEELTVSSIGNTDKRMVTWKDTVVSTGDPPTLTLNNNNNNKKKKPVLVRKELNRVAKQKTLADLDVIVESKSDVFKVLSTDVDVLDNVGKRTTTKIPTRKFKSVGNILKKYTRPPDDLIILSPPEEFAEEFEGGGSYLNARLKGVAELDYDDSVTKEIVVEGGANIAEWFETNFAQKEDMGEDKEDVAAEKDSLEDPSFYYCEGKGESLSEGALEAHEELLSQKNSQEMETLGLGGATKNLVYIYQSGNTLEVTRNTEKLSKGTTQLKKSFSDLNHEALGLEPLVFQRKSRVKDESLPDALGELPEGALEAHEELLSQKNSPERETLSLSGCTKNLVSLYQSGTTVKVTKDTEELSNETTQLKKNFSDLKVPLNLEAPCLEPLVFEKKSKRVKGESLPDALGELPEGALEAPLEPQERETLGLSGSTKNLLSLYQSDTTVKVTRDTEKLSNKTPQLKKSLSDLKLPLNHPAKSFSLDLEPLFFQRKFVFESESADFRKTCQDIRSISSCPSRHFAKFTRKKTSGRLSSKERQEILKIAAQKFIESTKKKLPRFGHKEGHFLLQEEEEEYSVPKKKRRVWCSDSDNTANFQSQVSYSEENCDDSATKTAVSSKNASATSATSSALSASVTPRTVQLIDKIAQGRKLKTDHSNVMLAISVWECDRLLQLDETVVSKVVRRLEGRQGEGRIKLPLIVGNRATVVAERRVREVDGEVTLPDICCDGLRREREGFKSDVFRSSSTYDPFEVAQRQFLELLECDDFKGCDTPATPRARTALPTPTPTTPLPAKKTVRSAESVKPSKRQSVIDPPVNFQDLDCDDFELVESMIEEEEEEGVAGRERVYLHNLINNKNSVVLDSFSGDCRKYGDDPGASIDPRLINENDNLSLPDGFRIDDYSPTGDRYSAEFDTKIEPKATKKPLVERSLSLVNRSKKDASFNNNNNVKKGSFNNKNVNAKGSKTANSSDKSVSSSDSKLQTKEEKKKSLPLLKRSMTLLDPSPKPSFKNKKEVNDFLNESTSVEKTYVQSSQEVTTPLDDILKAEDLFSVDDEMYEEYKKYEEMYLMEKRQHSATSVHRKSKTKPTEMNYGLLTNSEEEELPNNNNNNNNNKLSNDSAYGSLRKTSKHRIRGPKLTPLEPRGGASSSSASSSSSSGSEHGRHSPAPCVVAASTKLSKFCHECGTKFPVTGAKFCVECGAKRLVL